MAKIIAALLAGALGIPTWPALASGGPAGKSIDEREVRTVSAYRYSELLRLACLNGWRYRPDDIAGGFERSFEELKLALIDQGFMIKPETAGFELIVTEIRMNWRPAQNAPPEFSCFRARWSGD